MVRRRHEDKWIHRRSGSGCGDHTLSVESSDEFKPTGISFSDWRRPVPELNEDCLPCCSRQGQPSARDSIQSELCWVGGGPSKAEGSYRFAVSNGQYCCLAGYDTSGAVIVTHDGGKTWQRPSDAADNGPTCLYFLDEKHGWCMSGNYAATSTVCGTNDGGSTWERRRIL